MLGKTMIESATSEGKRDVDSAETRKESREREGDPLAHGKREEKFTARVRKTLRARAVDKKCFSRWDNKSANKRPEDGGVVRARWKTRKGDVWCKDPGKGADRERVREGSSGGAAGEKGRRRMFEIFPRLTLRLAMGNLYWFAPVEAEARVYGYGSIWFLSRLRSPRARRCIHVCAVAVRLTATCVRCCLP